jgi:chromate reductase, NAD(P)H dehydrogenase (quinone)
MSRLRILVLPGSLRTGSFNARLAAHAAKHLALSDATVTRLSLADYSLPLYDANLEAESGVPAPAVGLARQFAAHDAILLVSPEYNAGISPLMKNAIDWISRVREAGLKPFEDRVFALASASPGNFGGLRGLISLRQSLELGLGALVIPEQFILQRARDAFDAEGDFADADVSGRLARMLDALRRRTLLLRRMAE